MVLQKLTRFLDEQGVKYVTVRHSPAYTAQEIAASAHISGKEIAKTVMLEIDGKLAMAVLPASEKVDLEHLREVVKARRVELCREQAFAGRFGDCELGAMPPFGNLWEMPVYVARNLAADERIAFNAGTHTELIQLAYADFARLVKPKVVDFAVPEHAS